MMKMGMLLHNPTAGDEKHSKKALVKLLEDHGFSCRYASVKDEWEDFPPDIDFIIMAGGDGTVRKVLKGMEEKSRPLNKWPLALLPLGTANNIARTLGIEGDDDQIVESWHKGNIKQVDLGRIRNGKENLFFVEGLGCGLFPTHMKKAKESPEEYEGSPEENMKNDLKIFYDDIFSAKPVKCKLTIDEKDYSGEYLLLEVMNIRSVGTRLLLSPSSDPGDGFFDVVLIPEKDRELLAGYLYDKIKGEEKEPSFQTVRGKHIVLNCSDDLFHVDDRIVDPEKKEDFGISMEEGLLKFLVP